MRFTVIHAMFIWLYHKFYLVNYVDGSFVFHEEVVFLHPCGFVFAVITLSCNKTQLALLPFVISFFIFFSWRSYLMVYSSLCHKSFFNRSFVIFNLSSQSKVKWFVLHHISLTVSSKVILHVTFLAKEYSWSFFSSVLSMVSKVLASFGALV